MAINAAQAKIKTVADPNAAYESLLPLWQRSRAVCAGERYVKELDAKVSMNNMLIPFSPSMTQQQYDFFRAEAELPGVTSQFSRMIVGGLLRKQPVMKLPDDLPAGAKDWLVNEFSQDDLPMAAFLDSALWEEVQTSRAWVMVDYPEIPADLELTKQEMLEYKPYPILLSAEVVINTRTSIGTDGRRRLSTVIIRGMKEEFNAEQEFHPKFVETVWVHELDASNEYQVRIFQRQDEPPKVPVLNGKRVEAVIAEHQEFVMVDLKNNILVNGERLTFIPIWPLNGRLEAAEPTMMPIIDKEIALYNKLSRRNHLMYGASTYTPVISSDMTDDDFQKVVESGLGTWIKLRQGDTASVLETPTAALADMDRAIAASYEEMARLGIRMLSPETAQSGVALELRNASQTAQLGTLNTKISNVMRQIIVFMLNWRYDLDLSITDVEFTLSSDFTPSQGGPDWLRLATEWYQQGLIPRSVWLILLKQNDILPPDYNDEEGRKEITDDMALMNAGQVQQNPDFAGQISQ